MSRLICRQHPSTVPLEIIPSPKLCFRRRRGVVRRCLASWGAAFRQRRRMVSAVHSLNSSALLRAFNRWKVRSQHPSGGFLPESVCTQKRSNFACSLCGGDLFICGLRGRGLELHGDVGSDIQGSAYNLSHQYFLHTRCVRTQLTHTTARSNWGSIRFEGHEVRFAE